METTTKFNRDDYTCYFNIELINIKKNKLFRTSIITTRVSFYNLDKIDNIIKLLENVFQTILDNAASTGYLVELEINSPGKNNAIQIPFRIRKPITVGRIFEVLEEENNKNFNLEDGFELKSRIINPTKLHKF